jgi:lipopolysaccharide/colanic/teichoic acid biosynthesis glycosyltransferase
MLKRLFDLTVSALGLLALSPLILLLALAVRLGSEGPIFYLASRVGRDGKPFKLYKFRSMVINADKIGPAVTGAQDKRITPIGRLLRRTKLDELPQLLNVLKGEMSFVGPRPESPNYVAHYTADQRRVLSVRPGITSEASVKYRNEEAMLTGENWEDHYIKVIMPAKLAIDLAYIDQQSLGRDLSILLQTFLALFR